MKAGAILFATELTLLAGLPTGAGSALAFFAGRQGPIGGLIVRSPSLLLFA